LTSQMHENPYCLALPRYWLPENYVESRLNSANYKKWLLGFRDITSNASERTAIFSILPRVGVGHTAPLVSLSNAKGPPLILCFLGCVNSLTFDYITRQKIGGIHLTYSVLSQLPVPIPSSFTIEDISYISDRVFELVYTAWDMYSFAVDIWMELDPASRERVLARWKECNKVPPPKCDKVPSPFRWSEDRRAAIRAELDVYIARLYSLTRDEMRYILDPAAVYGLDFPGETFRVLKTKEKKLYGEYRTRRLVLEKWDE